MHAQRGQDYDSRQHRNIRDKPSLWLADLRWSFFATPRDRRRRQLTAIKVWLSWIDWALPFEKGIWEKARLARHVQREEANAVNFRPLSSAHLRSDRLADASPDVDHMEETDDVLRTLRRLHSTTLLHIQLVAMLE